jgi:hypothetical protein
MKRLVDVKRNVLVLWGMAVSLFLWYFVMISQNEFSVFQYLIFCTILFGGGLAYHVMSELAACPYTEENSSLWRKIRRIATADLRLSVLLDATTSAGNGSLSATTATGGVVHGPTRAELDPAHAQRIIGVTDDGDRGLIALAACQAYAKEVSTPK